MNSRLGRALPWAVLLAGLALLGVGTWVNGGHLNRLLDGMAATRWPIAVFFLLGLVLFVYAVLGLRARGETRVRPWVAGLFALGGLLFCSVGALVLDHNPGLVAQILEKDFDDEARKTALAAADLKPAPAIAAAGWPQWRGPNRDGRSGETGLNTDWNAKKPPVLWRRPLGGGFSSFAVVGGGVYTQDRQGDQERIVCLDAITGEPRWVHSYPADYSGFDSYGTGPRATPTVHEGRVYTVGATGIFLCLEPAAEGGPPKVLWQHNLLQRFRAERPQWGVACSPLIEGDLVVVQPGGPDGSVAAFNRITGDLAWASGDEGSGYSSPVAATLAGVRQVIAFSARTVSGLRTTDGHRLWSYPWPTAIDCNIATPIIAGNLVFISSDYGTGCALVEITGEGEKQEAKPVYVRRGKVMRNHHSTCVLHEGYLYGFDQSRLKCVDLRSGQEKWVCREPLGKGTQMFADGHLIILSENGTLSLVEASPEACRVKGSFELFTEAQNTWALPVFVDGRLYVRDGREVVCLDMTLARRASEGGPAR